MSAEGVTFRNEGVRLQIVTTARELVGSHYVNATDGAIPGGSGLKRHLGWREDTRLDHLAIHAGVKANGHVCVGRYARVGGFRFLPGSEEEAELIAYQKEISKKAFSTDDIPDFHETALFPRRDGPGSTIYLGEDCRGVRHFDCISFIAWVLRSVLGRGISHEVPYYESGGSGGKQFTVYKAGSFPTTFLNGDILTKKTADGQHIGFLTSVRTVIHASNEANGVLESPYGDGGWTGLARLNDSYIG